MLYKKGAEANLFLEEWHKKKIIRKHRIKKKYRNPKLDILLRQTRTRHEAKILTEARKLGVPTPLVYLIDLKETTLILQYIEAPKLKDLMIEVDSKTRKDLFLKLGKYIGFLHKGRIVHGDITTSNILVLENDLIFLDFGLSQYVGEEEIEPYGVDLHLLKRVLDSTHYKYSIECFESVLEGYRNIMGKLGFKIIERLANIENRGRYQKKKK
ncbi:MAG: KEOPS complex kinase/ATPase Bud32 [Candidatus Ranarchaeia archaeon]